MNLLGFHAQGDAGVLRYLALDSEDGEFALRRPVDVHTIGRYVSFLPADNQAGYPRLLLRRRRR